MNRSFGSDDSPNIIQSIKHWLSICDTRHIGTCSKPCAAQSEQHKTSWLIDVQDRCLVRGNSSAEYLALSYTWRNKTSEMVSGAELQLLHNNINVLTSANALEQQKSKIPKVILDAIELTRAIGKRYLWVDKLCIIQDDPDKASEFASMDRVYSGAYLTIIAAANYGMFSKPRDTIYRYHLKWSEVCATSNYDLQCGRDVDKEKHIRSYYRDVSLSEWGKRVWTYQEYILSRRVVFFLDTVIFWQCECALWESEYLRPEEGDQTQDRMLSDLAPLRQFLVPTSPDFGMYVDLICPYNGRELSYEKDALSACQGILSHLSLAFPGGFVFGLPRFYLDYALLWQPLKGGYGQRGSSVRRTTFPSWAWCGWQCFVDPESLELGLNIHQNRRDREITETWKLKYSVTWKLSGDTPGRLASSSNLISAQVSRAFFLPAAILKICKATKEYLKRLNKFKFRFSGFYEARINPVLTQNPLHELPHVVVLRNSEGEFSGLLRITGDSNCNTKEPIELIAISRGSANGKYLRNSFEEKVLGKSSYASPESIAGGSRRAYANGGHFRAAYNSAGRWVISNNQRGSNDVYRVCTEGDYEEDLRLLEYKDDQEYQFYNVLWVQRGDNNVAYRAGCGRVLAEAWEKNNPETVGVTLG